MQSQSLRALLSALCLTAAIPAIALAQSETIIVRGKAAPDAPNATEGIATRDISVTVNVANTEDALAVDTNRRLQVAVNQDVLLIG